MEAFVPSSGPSSAEVLIVGEAPGEKEVERGEPFVGPSGVEMTRMIQQAGLLRSECFITNVCGYRPPKNRMAAWFYPKTERPADAVFVNDRWVHPHVANGVAALEVLIDKLKPKVIIAFGNTPLWALTGEWGITKWRGSNLLSREINGQSYPLLPTYHPAAILRRWDWRYIAVHDLLQARRIRDNGLPKIVEDFTIRPSFDTVIQRLDQLLSGADLMGADKKLDIAVDIETRFRHITCVGLAWSPTAAICIPFLEIKAADKNYWKTVDEETEIVWRLKQLLTHPAVRVLGQNFSYDQQYFARRMFFIPNYKPDNFHDTMTAHHVMWAGLPKGLDFLSSFYCQETHVYWKDEGKEWNPKTMGEEQHWVYNCRDALRTYLIAQEQRKVYEALNFKSTAFGSPWTIQHGIHESILRAMLRGVRIDTKKKAELRQELGEVITRQEEYINYLLGHPLNPRSPKQLQALFYNDFKVKPVITYDRATGQRRRTCDAAALDTISKREVLLAPICIGIADVRSLGTFKSVTSQELDADNRMRCAYSVPGTETFRFNSKEDAFGYGTNLQNVSAGNEKAPPDSHLYRPNLRKMFVPDPGYAICDHDLEQADARIVAWESNCPSLKEIFNDPSRDLHNEHTEVIFGRYTGEGDPNRHRAKTFVHAANYAVTAQTLAATLGITVHEAERLLTRYFGERPEVLQWHEEIRIQLQTHRFVENVFGYRRFYFDRIEGLLKEALAWIPQSTVAIAINLGIKRVEETLPWADFLLQVHDSAVHQFPLTDAPVPGMAGRLYAPEDRFETIRRTMEIELPYETPMTIPVSGNWSLESWGHCK
jgi:DNA polymerase I-like protein with 3'-5' exonuclease and polymerase domains/uracil-DNA glycosylase